VSVPYHGRRWRVTCSWCPVASKDYIPTPRCDHDVPLRTSAPSVDLPKNSAFLSHDRHSPRPPFASPTTLLLPTDPSPDRSSSARSWGRSSSSRQLTRPTNLLCWYHLSSIKYHRFLCATCTVYNIGPPALPHSTTTGPARCSVTVSQVRFVFEKAGQHNLRWQSIADVPGLDITALLYRGEVVGAALGFYSNAEHAYLETPPLHGGGDGVHRAIHADVCGVVESGLHRLLPDKAWSSLLSMTATSTPTRMCSFQLNIAPKSNADYAVHSPSWAVRGCR
jgi:hypothetical protein